MESDILIVLVIMAITISLLITEIVRVDVTAILAMLALSWSGVLTTGEALSGFSSNAVVAMIAVMIMGEGIARTGVMSRFSRWVLDKTGSNKTGILGILSLSVGFLSGVIQNIGAVALFLPGVMDISRRSKLPVSAMIMPLGFAAIVGGTLTMVGSGHLILTNDLLIGADLEPYGLFAVTPVGIVLLLSAVLFFLFFGRYMFPKADHSGRRELTEQEKLIDAFNLSQNIRYYHIPEGSPLVGKSVEESGVWSRFHLNVLALSNKQGASAGRVHYAPWRETRFETGQIVALYGEMNKVQAFSRTWNLEDAEEPGIFEDLADPDASGFAEVLVPPRSDLVGMTIRRFSMRKRYAVEPLMLFSNGEKVEGDFSDQEIHPGDTFIIYGTWKHIKELQCDRSFVVATPFEVLPRDRSRVHVAAVSFLLAVVLALTGFSIAIAFLTGAMAMVLTRVISIQQAYKAIEWKVVFLLVGLIPLGVAMQNTGTADFLAQSMMSVVEEGGMWMILLSVAVLSTVFSLVMSNVGAVVVLAPLVVSIGTLSGLEPRPLVLLAAVCAGNSFVLPTHQVNALLMTAGGYSTRDYFKAGGGMTLLFLFVSVTFFYFFFF